MGLSGRLSGSVEGLCGRVEGVHGTLIETQLIFDGFFILFIDLGCAESNIMANGIMCDLQTFRMTD